MVEATLDLLVPEVNGQIPLPFGDGVNENDQHEKA